MTDSDRAKAFLEGRYKKGSSGGMSGGPGGDSSGGAPSGGAPSGEAPSGEMPSGEAPSGDMPSGGAPSGDTSSSDSSASQTGSSSNTGTSTENAEVAANSTGDTMTVGTPDAGTTQAAGSSTDSSNYSSYSDILSAYQKDVAEVKAGDAYGNNIVELYDPLNYIGAEGTAAPVWTRIVMGASEGDMSMLASLNMEIAWLANGTDACIEWH